MTELDPFVTELKRWRDLRRLSQSRLAQGIQYDRSYISKIESGQELPAADFATKADKYLQAGGALVRAHQRSALDQASRRAAAADSDPPLAADGSGIVRFYPDFVDIEADWDTLFAGSTTLDLAFMYSATWRNTHRKRLHTMAERPDGRIRVVLPDPSSNSVLPDVYAEMIAVPADDLRRKINEAIEDFTTIEPGRHIEVYITNRVFRHALYVFSREAILALYALCGERIPTPAILVSEGGLMEFMRMDFDHLLDHGTRIP